MDVTRYTVVMLGRGKHNHGAYCKGVHELLRGVDECGSLYTSAGNMGMAYSKAWRIVKDCERRNRIKLLDRDGARGSKLTKSARKWMERFEEEQSWSS